MSDQRDDTNPINVHSLLRLAGAARDNVGQWDVKTTDGTHHSVCHPIDGDGLSADEWPAVIATRGSVPALCDAVQALSAEVERLRGRCREAREFVWAVENATTRETYAGSRARRWLEGEDGE